MKIEVWKGKKGWHWHFRSKGRVTADSEAFPSKSNAARAAKAVVRGVAKPLYMEPHFEAVADGAITTITWHPK